MVSAEKYIKQALGAPTVKQELFHRADTRYVAYGGAKGGGKSHAIRQKATYLAIKHPGIRILVTRRTLTELEKNHTQPLLKAYMALPPAVRPKYRDVKKVFEFKNGSVISLGYCDSENDALRYQGQEYDVIFLDEATRYTEFQFRRIDECVRGVNGFPKRTYLTCNPGGVGHAWVKRLFIDKNYKPDEDPADFTFIQARVYDNQPLFDADPAYRKALEAYMQKHALTKPNKPALEYAKPFASYVKTLKMGTLEEQRAYLEGDWDVFTGLYFGEFDDAAHTFEPFLIPYNWRRSVTIDYGLDMLAVLWIAIDENGFAYVYREHLEKNLTVSAAAKRILELGGSDVIEQFIAPPDLWSRRQETGKSVYDIFLENGIPLIKAGNERVHGWLSVKEWLKIREYKRDGTVKEPYLKIFRSCANLISHMQKLQHDDKKKDDVAIQPHDITHAPDALRYWCSLRQICTPVAKIEACDQFASERTSADDVFGAEVTEEYLLY